jgi:predicted GNAT family acetyltransferase
MRVISFNSSDGVWPRVRTFLMAREAENNFFLGLMARPALDASAVLRAVEHEGQVVGVAVMTPPYSMVITRMPAGAAGILAAQLADQDIAIPGVWANSDVLDEFARTWIGRRDVKVREGLALGTYQVERVVPPGNVPGYLRVAGEGDLEVLLAWRAAFTQELEMKETSASAALEETVCAIAEGRRFLWHDPAASDQAVSMCGTAGPTPNGIRMQAVYTPPEMRRRGYASACVAAASQRLLDSGKKYCFLYTDLANPTSNKIYRTIGYHHVCDTRQVFFDHDPERALR